MNYLPKLGYLPRSDKKHISRLPAQGVGLTCWVVESNPLESTWRMVKVEVLLLNHHES